MTSTVENAQETLDVIVPYLMKNEVNFKYVSNMWELYLKNSKYGDRSSSGKFVTIYPPSDEVFEKLITDLEKLLEGIAKGPYILSDKRWKKTNLFFRYGGFVEMFMPDVPGKKLAIKDLNGNFVEDKREPIYSVPNFVEEPDFIKAMDIDWQDAAEEVSEFDKYAIESALHFSNGGGVYLATKLNENSKVVLKEGRPGAGLDGYGNDGVARIKHESKMLETVIDVKSVVNYYETFNAWEHIFLAEEFVVGAPLHSWIAAYYPFSPAEDTESYAVKAGKIIKNLKNAIKEIHSKDIGMGDLQPMNVMVDDDCNIKLIDFEAADILELEKRPGLETPGFVTPLAKTRRQSDWFALLRIARYMFLPIGPVQDISDAIQSVHDKWIEDIYGRESINLVHDIEEECKKYFPVAFKNQPTTGNFLKIEDVSVIIEKLREGILRDITPLKEQLIPGDIRQYEMNGGMINIATGGFGVAMAFHRTGNMPKDILNWAMKHSDVSDYKGLENGLYVGKAGIAGVLYELGLQDEAFKWYESVNEWGNLEDISIFSGLSGIGLSFLSYAVCEKNEDYLNYAKAIGNRIEKLFKTGIEPRAYDLDFIPYGFFDGWSGAAYFLQYLYENTQNRHWLELSYEVLKKDMDLCMFSEEKEAYQLKDNSRFVPYIAGGSAGIGLAMMNLMRLDQTVDWKREILGIANGTISKCFYSGGLFRGLTGLLACANAIDKSSILDNGVQYVEECFKTINLYLVESENVLYLPGDYNYRFSADVFSGAAGAICVLNDVADKNTYCSWLPIPTYRKLRI